MIEYENALEVATRMAQELQEYVDAGQAEAAATQALLEDWEQAYKAASQPREGLAVMAADQIVMVCPNKQIDAWVNHCKQLWEFWDEVRHRKTWALQRKTENQVINLTGYYEGQYDMALKFRQFVAEKTI